MTNLTEQMQHWRDGAVSDSEILAALCEAQAEVIGAMRQNETRLADARAERMGLRAKFPFSDGSR
jgi:hypothetical protein